MREGQREGHGTVVTVMRLYCISPSPFVFNRACGGLSGSLEDFGDVSVYTRLTPVTHTVLLHSVDSACVCNAPLV